ncbi:MAG: DHH family phosphoesterase [Phycisphaerae bacterium]
MCANYVIGNPRGIAEKISQAQSLLVISHARPDGDALGSAMTLARLAGQAGINAWWMIPGDIPERFGNVLQGNLAAGVDDFDELAAKVDVIAMVDTHATAQLDDISPKLEPHRRKIVVVDHHATGDDLSDYEWIDTSAAATGILIHELLKELRWPVDKLAAEALGTAILTDTGWLRFSSTDGRCLRTVASLVEAGLSMDKLYRQIHQQDRPERLRLLQRALDSLKLECDGRLAVMLLRRSDFAEVGAEPDETENMVNEPFRVKTIDASVIFVETESAVRVSLRSRERVDVSRVAKKFGGGGHERAAGCRVEGDIDEVCRKVVASFSEAIDCE